jgi:hypothetical protein
MGQSQSNASTTTAANRHDDASTRTLHSSSMTSHRPLSFFRRISNRLHVTHPSRRFGRTRTSSANRANDITTTNESETIYTNATAASINTNMRIHTSASSTTSSVRRATQEAARAAAAVTGPPSFLLQPQQNNNSSSITSSDSANTNSFWNELLSLPAFRDSNSNGSNSFLRYLQIPLRVQELESQNSGVQSSASSTTSRRMHILVLEYRTTNTNQEDTTPLTPPPAYRFLGLRRPRSEVSTTSSTDTIQSMPLSMNSTQTNHRTQHSTQQQQEGQWIVYVLNNNNHPALQALSSSVVLEDNPSYEDLLWLSNILGPARPNTTTQAAVDEAIPVVDWSDDTKKQLKDEQCLVCLDEFTLKQPVRVLKCHHVFHRECVDRWLCEAHNSCPVCRGVPV